MFKNSRKAVVVALAATVAVTGVAVAGPPTGADINEAGVVGKVKPSKLDNKKFKPVNLFQGVVNSPESAGQQITNAKSEFIETSKNVKIDLSKAPVCTIALPNGTTTQQARDDCPGGSFLGEGTATVHAADTSPACPVDADTDPCVVGDQVVSIFNGPAAGQLRLHTYGTLGVSSPTVQGFIVNAVTNGYGKALSVPNAPVTGPFKITSFNATVDKDTKVATAKCKPKEIKFKRTVTYTDNSFESVGIKQPCKVK